MIPQNAEEADRFKRLAQMSVQYADEIRAGIMRVEGQLRLVKLIAPGAPDGRPVKTLRTGGLVAHSSVSRRL